MQRNALERREPHKESDWEYDIYCPFKGTPNDWENAPIRFIFELTKRAAGNSSRSTTSMNDRGLARKE